MVSISGVFEAGGADIPHKLRTTRDKKCHCKKQQGLVTQSWHEEPSNTLFNLILISWNSPWGGPPGESVLRVLIVGKSVLGWGSGGEAAHTSTSARRSVLRGEIARQRTSTSVKSITDRWDGHLYWHLASLWPPYLQVCKDVWQNQCRGNKRRLKRSPRSSRRPYWLDKNNIETIFDQNFPVTQSDLPLADPGQGSTYEFASPPKSKSCWKKVRKCEWKKYKTSCRNEPTVTCKPGTIKDCRNRCKNRWFCDKCPTTSKPKPTKRPVGPTRPPQPPPTRPSKPGPPAPPPLGTFIGPPGIPIKQDVDLSVIDVRRQKKLPWPRSWNDVE